MWERNTYINEYTTNSSVLLGLRFPFFTLLRQSEAGGRAAQHPQIGDQAAPAFGQPHPAVSRRCQKGSSPVAPPVSGPSAAFWLGSVRRAAGHPLHSAAAAELQELEEEEPG